MLLFQVSMYLARQAHQRGVPAEMAAKEQQVILKNMFHHEDANKDDMISFEEFRGPKHDEL